MLAGKVLRPPKSHTSLVEYKSMYPKKAVKSLFSGLSSKSKIRKEAFNSFYLEGAESENY